MKKVLVILLAVLLGLSVAGCGLEGKTLYLPEKIEIYYDNEYAGCRCFVYGKNGFLEEIGNGEDKNASRLAVTCDENGNVLSVSSPNALQLGIVSSYTYTYSTKGNLLSSVFPTGNQKQWEYNTKNQIISASSKTGSGTVTNRVYEYDDDGKLLTAHWYTSDKLKAVNTFAYDKEGRMILETLCNDREAVLFKVEYTYQRGKTVAVWSTFRGENVQTITYTFDHAGNLIEEAYGEGSNGIRYVYTYKEVKVSAGSPRKSYTIYPSLPETGLTNMWR